MLNMKNKWSILVCLINFSATIRLVESCARSSVKLERNGYQNVLIGISEGVEENPKLIERIKVVFTEASESLAVATRNRTYFKQIKILIPSTWTSFTDAEDSTEEISRSDIVVANPDEKRDFLSLANAPFVVKATGCGEPGNFIHLTPDYLLSPDWGRLYGPYGKTIVHEWAHYRWGVFDEYPVDVNSARFYAVEGGIYEGSRCPLASPGYEFNPSTSGGCNHGGEPDSSCFWIVKETGVEGGQASIMYNHSLNHVSEFCDNDLSNEFTLHNSNAPTMQNIHCSGKSVWEVMREHPDFANGFNPTRKLETTIPDFKIIKAGVRTRRTVLVLDKSESMTSDSPTRIETLRQACNNYITSFVSDGDALGIVTFDSTAQITLGLTTVSSTSKQDMLDALPLHTSGYTSIGQGLKMALSLLAGVQGGHIILVSDGKENREPNIDTVFQSISDAKVVVHTIAISLNAEPEMEDLARQTGGLTYFVNTAEATTTANEAFKAIAQTNLDESQKDIGLQSSAQEMRIGETILRSTSIDSTIGEKTKFNFDYTQEPIAFIVTSPSGKVYDKTSSSVTCRKQFKSCTLLVDGIAETGAWNYSISNNATFPQTVAVTVTSQASGGSSPISAQAFWGHSLIDMTSSIRKQVLYASVSKGYIPILGANVKATIERPAGGKIIIELKDTGTGADVTRDDGVYSAFFVAFSGNGRYAMQVTVISMEGTTVSPGRVLGMKAASQGTGAYDSPAETFQRIASGGSFQLQNVMSGAYEPGKINDLRVSYVSYNLQTVALEWTAMGRELDHGKASYYELRYSTNFTAFKNDFSSQVTSDMILDNKTLGDPLPPGEAEFFEIKMPTAGNITYVFGLVVWDTNGRNVKGPLSNLASVSMLFPEHPALSTSNPELIKNNGPQISTELVIILCVSFVLISMACFITLFLRHNIKRITRSFKKFHV